MTESALDSAFAPSNAQIAAAKAAGIRAWFGYFKLLTNDGIYNGWADSDFERVLAGGLQTGAYCSGWDDPLAVKARAGRLGIRIRLDVEGGIRPDGPWVQGWCDAAGSGLYGNAPVFVGRRAADYIVAVFPLSGDPGGESWPSWLARPTDGPCGWQWAGTHAFAGISVDSTWLDDGFFAFSAAGQDLGGLDMATADQLVAAVTWPPPPRPASVTSISDADLIAYANTSGVTWDAVTVKYGPDGRDYIYRLIHPLTIAQGLAQAIAGLKIGVDPASLAAVLAKLDDLKAHPAVVSDPALATQVASLAKHLGVGTA